ncbi:transcriptional regulator [Bryobacterales bacterium F-183]|nr:transcriptional regulator [Bryobacterales bacterium F-183]
MQPGNDPSLCVCANLRKASRAITQLYDNALRPAGIRSTQFNILAEVHVAGEATLVELAGRLHLDQTTLTRSLRLLEHMQLLERAPRKDGRLKALRLTAEGTAMLHRALPLWRAAQDEVVAALGGAKVWDETRGQLGNLVHAALLTSSEE